MCFAVAGPASGRCRRALLLCGLMLALASVDAGPLKDGGLVEIAPGSAAAPADGTGPVPRAVRPELSTGNKSVDILLDLPGKDGMSRPSAQAPSEAEVLKAAAESRAARERLRALGQVRTGELQDGGTALPPADLTSRSSGPDKAPQREWIAPPAGAGEGSAALMNGGDRTGLNSHRDADRGSPANEVYASAPGDGLLAMLPPEVRAFLRDHRYELLGAGVLLGLLSLLVKLYDRRI